MGRAASGTSLLSYRTTELNTTTGLHEIVDTPFTRSGNDLVMFGSAGVGYQSATLPPNNGLISDCGVDQP
jgi:hypothetical protein